MFLLRRVAFRALSVQPRALNPQSRSIISITSRDTLRSRQQWFSAPFQRRHASSTDEPAKLSEAQTTDESISTETASGTAAEVNAAEPKDVAMPDLAVNPDKGVVVESASKQGGEVSSQQSSTRSSGTYVSAGVANSTLYVGNLFFEVSEKQLKERFEQYGPISKVTIIYDQRGLSKGFGYVEFENAQDARTAIESADQDTFHGRRMSVQQHRKRERAVRQQQAQNDPAKTLFIGNMSYEMSDKDLNDLFRQVKGVVDVRVAIDRNTGQPRGFAHADFIDVESATNAKRYLEQKEIYGRTLRVDYTQSSTGGRK